MDNIKLNTIYSATIIDEIDDSYIVYVSENFNGKVCKREFNYTSVKKGDVVEVVIGQDSKTGDYFTSHTRARRYQAIEELKEAFKNGTQLDGKIQYCDEDGVHIDYHGYNLLLPPSQQNINKRKRRYERGESIPFVVIYVSKSLPLKIDISYKWIQFQLITEELEEMRKESKILEGFVCEKCEEADGYFVNYKGMDVLMPFSEVGTDVQIEEHNPISFIVKKADIKRCQVIVSHRLVEKVEKKVKIDLFCLLRDDHKILNGFVKSITEDTLIVDYDSTDVIIPKDEIALIPVDNIETYRYKSVNFRIVYVNYQSGQITGSIKDIQLDTIREKLSTYEKGTVFEAPISEIIQSEGKYTLLVKIDDDCVGYVLDGDIPWKWKENNSNLKIGNILPFAVLGLDYWKAQLILSLKAGLEGRNQIEALQSMQFVENNPNCVGNYFDATIKNISNNQVIIDVDGYKGFIDRQDLSENSNRHPDDIVFRGEQRQVVFKELKNGKLYFSIKELEGDCYDKKLYDSSIEELLDDIEIKSNRFIAEIVKSTRRYNSQTNNQVKEDTLIFARNFYAVEDGGKLLADPYTGGNISVLQDNEDKTPVEDGKYYEVEITLASRNLRLKKKNPYLFTFKVVNGPVENPYSKAVIRNFYKFREPKANVSLAGMLDEVGNNMYSSKSRMFFELLQNADDASAKNNVRMKIQVLDKYLIIVHDGHAFDRLDFEAITSAANSAKKRNSQKTGYKGIGFKSVFTHSFKVFIKTGGFNFVFDKFNPDFSTFDTFYTKVNRFNSEEEQKDFFEENLLEKQNFDSKKHIPWHLLPFWVSDLPQELEDSIFSSNSVNVAIALNMEEASTEEYKNIILGILNEPRFMLFLRNTHRIQYIDGDRTISLAKVKNNGVATLKNSFSEEDKTIKFSVDDEVGIIDIREETLLKEKVPFHKKRIDESRTIFVQETEKGTKELDSIPERIAERDETIISLAVPLMDGLYASADMNRNSLYAYLPMNEARFHFPFYVNADFVLSSDREGVKDENLWNQFLFGKLGSIIPKWIGKLANQYQTNYLNLLQPTLFDEELEGSTHLAKAFNENYSKALVEIPFIINDKGETVLQKDIIIDHSGLALIIGEDNFCSLLQTKKRLPVQTCDISILDNPIFTEIEHKHLNDILSILLESNRKKYIRHWMKDVADKFTRAKVLLWLVDNYRVSKDSLIADVMQALPIFRVGTRYQSLNEIKERKNNILLNDNFNPVKDILELLGFSLSEPVSKHPVYKIAVEKQWLSGVDNDKFKAIQSSTASHVLSSENKLKLFSQFASTSVMSALNIKSKDLKSWQLFNNQNGKISSLDKLIHIDGSTDGGLLAEFKISDQEYDDSLANYLVPGKYYYRDIIYPNWANLTSLVGGSEELAKTLYNFTSQAYQQSEIESVVVSSFINSNGSYSSAIVFTGEKYDLPKSCLCASDVASDTEVYPIAQKIVKEHIPAATIITLLTKKPFSIKKQKLLDATIDDTITLTADEVKHLLSYCQKKQETLLKTYWIEKAVDDTYRVKALAKDNHSVYTSDPEVLSLISTYTHHLHLLPEEFSDYATMDGILTGDSLKTTILESVKEIILTASSFTNIATDNNYKLIKLFSSITEISDAFKNKIRNIIFYQTENGTKTSITSVTLNQNILFGGHTYPLSDLMPSDNEAVQSLNSLIERLRQNGIKEDVLTKLFNLTVPTNFDNSVFSALNKSQALSNGVQLAFVLNYAKSNNLNRINCFISSVDNKNISLIGVTWFRDNYAFVDPKHSIPEKYVKCKDYLELNFKCNLLNFSIKNDILDYSVLKAVLSDVEKHELLTYLYNKWKDSNTVLPEQNLIQVCSRLGIVRDQMFLSDCFLLTEEKLPDVVKNWIMADSTGEKDKQLFARNFLKIKDESDPAIMIRKYLSGELKELTLKGRISESVSKKTASWISCKKINLDHLQYELLSALLAENTFQDKIDTNKLAEATKYVYPEYSTSRYGYYTYNSKMPRIVSLPSYNNYVCHEYEQGEIALISGKIIINDNCFDNLEHLLLEEILPKYPENYTYPDYIEYRTLVNQGGVTGGATEDDGLDSSDQIAISNAAQNRVKEWLIERGYELTIEWDGYSTIEGVMKDGIEYPIVVKSYKSNKYKFSLSPNQWMHLMKENSTLLIVDGNNEVLYTTREELIRGKDLITLSFDIENLDHEDRVGALAKTLSKMYFKKVYFDFDKLRRTQYHIAEELDNHAFYRSNPNTHITTGEDEDWK